MALSTEMSLPSNSMPMTRGEEAYIRGIQNQTGAFFSQQLFVVSSVLGVVGFAVTAYGVDVHRS